mgnify:CR=1 FL=1
MEQKLLNVNNYIKLRKVVSMDNKILINEEIWRTREKRVKSFDVGNPNWLYWDGILSALLWINQSEDITLDEFVNKTLI